MKRVVLWLLAFGQAGGLALSAELPPDPAGAPVPLTPAFITALADEAQTNHPGLRAAGARVNAAESEVASIRTWEDPMVMLGGQFADAAMRADEGDLIYGVQQKLPLFGLPGRERNLAREGLEVERAEETFRFQSLRRDLAQALFRVALAQRTVEVGEEDLRWLEATVQTTEQRYRVGGLPQTQLLRVQNERALREDQIRTDRLRVVQALAVVNRLLGRSLDERWPRLELPAVAGPVEYSPRLVELAVANEPGLRTMHRRVQQAEAAVELSRRRQYPEVAVGAEGRHYTGNGDFRQAMVTVSVSLPWLNDGKYRHDVRRESARRQAAEFEVADYELGVREEVRRLTVGLDAMRREALLYRDEIIPRSGLALTSATSSWTTDRALFFDVMESRRLLIDAKLSYARAVAEQYQMLSELVLCCGLGDLEALMMIGAEAEPASAITR